MFALRVTRGVGQHVGLRAVDPAKVGEEQDPVMGGGHEEVAHHIIALQVAPRTPRPPRRCERYNPESVRLGTRLR